MALKNNQSRRELEEEKADVRIEVKKTFWRNKSSEFFSLLFF